MKTLKVFVILSIVSSFAVNKVNCQPVREELTSSMGFYIPCSGEFISGVVFWERTAWDNKIQLKVKDGILKGAKSHLDYSVTEVINHQMWFDQSAENKTFTRTLLVRLDGKLIARLPMLIHYTINANGEETVEFTKIEIDCK